MIVRRRLDIHAQDLLALILSGFALLLLATALGAALMWRVAHQPNRPPALPVWVSSLLVAGGALMIAASVVAGQSLGIVSATLTSIGFVIQFVQSLRHRPSSGQ